MPERQYNTKKVRTAIWILMAIYLGVYINSKITQYSKSILPQTADFADIQFKYIYVCYTCQQGYTYSLSVCMACGGVATHKISAKVLEGPFIHGRVLKYMMRDGTIIVSSPYNGENPTIIFPSVPENTDINEPN